MAYKGRYKPKNITKYIGDHTKVIYRSLWERKFMVYCDTTDSVLEWGSEEVVIPYLSPIDGKWHRYYVDFLVRVKTHKNIIETKLIEIKPKKQCVPPKIPEKKTRRFITEVKRWGVNSAKWKYASEFAKQKGWQFVILNEDHLSV